MENLKKLLESHRAKPFLPVASVGNRSFRKFLWYTKHHKSVTKWLLFYRMEHFLCFPVPCPYLILKQTQKADRRWHERWQLVQSLVTEHLQRPEIADLILEWTERAEDLALSYQYLVHIRKPSFAKFSRAKVFELRGTKEASLFPWEVEMTQITELTNVLQNQLRLLFDLRVAGEQFLPRHILRHNQAVIVQLDMQTFFSAQLEVQTSAGQFDTTCECLTSALEFLPEKKSFAPVFFFSDGGKNQ